MAATRIYLVRHGEAEGNRDLRYLGVTDVPLTARGAAQARDLGATFADVAIAAIYTSPLQRTLATATAIAAPHGQRPIALPALRELDFGAWEGMTRAEVAASASEALRSWEGGEPAAAPPEGESPAAVQARVVPALRQIAADHAGANVVAVSHVTPIKIAICAALDLPPRSIRRMWLDPASVTLIEWDATSDRASLRLFNALRPDR